MLFFLKIYFKIVVFSSLCARCSESFDPSRLFWTPLVISRCVFEFRFQDARKPSTFAEKGEKTSPANLSYKKSVLRRCSINCSGRVWLYLILKKITVAYDIVVTVHVSFHTSIFRIRDMVS